MTSYYVFFALQLYAENMWKDTRFEFRRVSVAALDWIYECPKWKQCQCQLMNIDFKMSDTKMDSLTQALSSMN